jgi:hypothetical protein
MIRLFSLQRQQLKEYDPTSQNHSQYWVLVSSQILEQKNYPLLNSIMDWTVQLLKVTYSNINL